MLNALVSGGADVHALKRNDTELHMLHTSTTTSINLLDCILLNSERTPLGMASQCGAPALTRGQVRDAVQWCHARSIFESCEESLAVKTMLLRCLPN